MSNKAYVPRLLKASAATLTSWGSLVRVQLRPFFTCTEAQTLASMGETVPPSHPTVLQRMGGIPQHLLSVGGLSDRETRRAGVTERIQARH